MMLEFSVDMCCKVVSTSLFISSNRSSFPEPSIAITIGLIGPTSNATTRFPPAKSVKPVLEAIMQGILLSISFVFLAVCTTSSKDLNSRLS